MDLGGLACLAVATVMAHFHGHTNPVGASLYESGQGPVHVHFLKMEAAVTGMRACLSPFLVRVSS